MSGSTRPVKPLSSTVNWIWPVDVRFHLAANKTREGYNRHKHCKMTKGKLQDHEKQYCEMALWQSRVRGKATCFWNEETSGESTKLCFFWFTNGIKYKKFKNHRKLKSTGDMIKLDVHLHFQSSRWRGKNHQPFSKNTRNCWFSTSVHIWNPTYNI